MNHLKDYIRIARPDHWIKQFFIFPGTIFAFFLIDNVDPQDKIIPILLAFLATSFIASANYTINEWLDAQFDKFHPTKKFRRVVSGNIKLHGVIVEYALLTLLGFACALLVSPMTFYMELWLWIMGIIYNVKPMRTKEIPYVDVLSESVNNAIRLLIGWFSITNAFVPPHQHCFGLLDGRRILDGNQTLL